MVNIVFASTSCTGPSSLRSKRLTKSVLFAMVHSSVQVGLTEIASFKDLRSNLYQPF